MNATRPRLSNWNLINSILNDQTLTGEERFVAIVIATHRNVLTGACHPSQRKIAELTKLSKTRVHSRIRSLVKKGVMKAERMNGNLQSPCCYRFRHDEFVLDFAGLKNGPSSEPTT